MRRYGLLGNVMFGFALAALGCAGSRSYQRYASPKAVYPQYGHSLPKTTSTGEYCPPPAGLDAEPSAEGLSPLTPIEAPRHDPNEIPPPPSFDRGEFLAPPESNREPLSANNTSGLKRLRVPLKLQPITWRSLKPIEDEPISAVPASADQRFGHSLRAPR